jgi:hypothetical protein
MNKLFKWACITLFVAGYAKAQVTPPPKIVNVTALPATCRIGGPLYQKTTATVALYECTALNTLTVVGPCLTCATSANDLSFFAPTTSAQFLGVISDETGSGLVVGATSPTLTTPVLGVATATSINKVALTAPATAATLTLANNKTFTVNNSITLAGTDSTTMTFPATTATIARTDAAQTFTGHNTFEGVTPTGATGTANMVFSTSPTITTPDIVGTTAAGNANAGSVGELLSAAIAFGSRISLTTSTSANVTSVSLTAGDWDCFGVVDYAFGATTSYTALTQGINTTSATLGAQDTYTDFGTAASVPGNSNNFTLVTPVVRVNVNSTTTTYLISQATFTVSTLQAYGTIRCRRIR